MRNELAAWTSVGLSVSVYSLNCFASPGNKLQHRDRNRLDRLSSIVEQFDVENHLSKAFVGAVLQFTSDFQLAVARLQLDVAVHELPAANEAVLVVGRIAQLPDPSVLDRRRAVRPSTRRLASRCRATSAVCSASSSRRTSISRCHFVLGRGGLFGRGFGALLLGGKRRVESLDFAFPLGKRFGERAAGGLMIDETQMRRRETIRQRTTRLPKRRAAWLNRFRFRSHAPL